MFATIFYRMGLEYQISKDTPVYINEGKFYYPELALQEELEILRKVLDEFPLVWDYFRNTFVDPNTGEKYVVVETLADFVSLRNCVDQVSRSLHKKLVIVF